jgi:hypothetical protein
VAEKRHHFVGHECEVMTLVFSPNGALLAAESSDAPVFCWGVYGKKSGAKEEWTAAEDRERWEELASKDAKIGFQTVRRLVQQPAAAVALLKGKMRPVEGVAKGSVQKLVSALSDDDFNTRQKATAELEGFGERILGELQEARQVTASLETKRRLEGLLTKLETSPEAFRRGRVLEILEQIATPDALALLDTLARGAPEARLTREAMAARQRLRER